MDEENTAPRTPTTTARPQEASPTTPSILPCGCPVERAKQTRCAAWFRLECNSSSCRGCTEADRTNEFGFGSSHAGFPSDRCLCANDVPCEPCDVPWEGILDDEELLPLMEALEKMDGQQYWDTEHGKKREFRMDMAVPRGETDQSVRDKVKEYLDVDKWPSCEDKKGDEKRVEVRRLWGGAKAADNMAAIRLWTCPDVQIYKVIASVSYTATAPQCLKKIKPYLRRLYEALTLLPDEFVSVNAIFRAETQIRARSNGDDGGKVPFKKGDEIPFRCFTSFSTDPSVVKAFKAPPALEASADPGTGLIDASQEFTLKERLRQFFYMHACDNHIDEMLKEADAVASRFEDDVFELNERLCERFKKKLPERGEKQDRCVICIDDGHKGVGFNITIFSVFPAEKEVVLEAGTLLQVCNNSLDTWMRFGEEEDHNRQQLKMRMGRVASLLTARRSRVAIRVDGIIQRRELVARIEAFDDAEDGDAIREQIRRLLDARLPVREAKCASNTTRSASKSSRGAPAVAARSDARRQVLECLEDLHDFEGACGWLVRVTVRLHDGTDDEEGTRVKAAALTPHERRFKVEAETLIRVTVTNWNLSPSEEPLEFVPWYIGEDRTETPEASGLKWEFAGTSEPVTGQELINPRLEETLSRKTELTQDEWDAVGIRGLSKDHFIKSGDSYFKPADLVVSIQGGDEFELPYPLQKDVGEKEDGWHIRDPSGATVLRLIFEL